MSHPIPTEERFLTEEDLERYLRHIDDSMLHYRTNQRLNPDEYNLRMMKKLDLMAVHAIARFHNQ